jgi:hypothetical protein
MDVPDGEEWMKQCRALQKDITDCRVTLTDGDGTQKTAVRRRINRITKSITDLASYLSVYEKSPGEYKLTAPECRRRRELLATAAVERDDLNNKLNGTSPSANGRNALMAGGAAGSGAGRGVNSAARAEIEDRSVEDTLQKQNQVMRDQDDDLEALSKIVDRQKQLGISIGDELDSQNKMLDETTALVDKTNTRMKAVTKKTEKVRLGSRMGCMMFVVAVLLAGLIALVVILVKEKKI